MSGSNGERADARPIVTVIVLFRERYGLTESVIDQIVRTIRTPARLIYADAGTPEALRAKIAARSAEWGLEVIRFDERLWPSQVRQRIAGLIDTKYAVFIDNDMHVLPGWLERLVECAEETGAGLVGPLYLWGDNGRSERVHMAGGELKTTSDARGILLHEHHRDVDRQAGELKLERGRCDFVEFHCMLMRRELYRAPGMFDETIVCVHEHIHAALLCREMGYSIYMEPSARVVYLAYVPYALAELGRFRWRWSFEAGESSIAAFAKRWGFVNDEHVFGVKRFLISHVSDIDPVRSSLHDRSSSLPMRESDLKQTITGLIELAHARGYTARDIANIKSAHWTALLLSSGGYRPCGRPFINHLLGTASVLAHFGFESRLIVGALLHAAYTHAPRLRGGAQETVETVTRILGGAGSPVDRMVRAYTLRAMRWANLAGLDNWQDVATTEDADTAIIAMANLVDMRLSGEVRSTGRTDDDDLAALAKAEEICDIIGVPGLADSLRIEERSFPPDLFGDGKRPKASFRLEGSKAIPMVNPAFFDVQRSIAANAPPAFGRVDSGERAVP
jgi:GT2 family glycosyltransferase